MTILDDLRFAFRSLIKRPGFAAIAIATLALGIGVNAAIFSLVDGVLLRPLPFERSDQLVHVLESAPPRFPFMSVSYPNFLDWRERNQTFSDLAAHRFDAYTLTEAGTPELVRTAQVSANLFAMLRVEPILGRTFTEDEDLPGTPKVAVMSHALWQERFGGEASALGENLLLDGEPYEIIGVMPASFSYPFSSNPAKVWLPIGHFSADWLEARGNHPGINATGRIADGFSYEQAKADLESIAAALATEYPESNTGSTVATARLQDRYTTDIKPALAVLSGAVVLVLLVACVNVANLLLVRAAGRGAEMAVRSAIGAGRRRLLRQLITESVLLGVIGGLVGVGLAFVALKAMIVFVDLDLPVYSHVQIDLRVMAFAFGMAILTGFLFGLAPALHIAGGNMVGKLRDAGRATVGTKGRRLRGGLVIAEVALALVLLIGSGLFLRSFAELWRADPGFDAENVLIVDIGLNEKSHSEPEQQHAYFTRAMERIRALPGVVTAGHSLPLLGGWQSTINMEGQAVRAPGDRISTEVYRVDHGLFEALGLRHLTGRLFTAADRDGSTKVAVVDERFANTVWPGEDPIGKRFLFGDPESEHTETDDEGNERVIPLEARWIEVVGTVAHVKSYGVNEDSRIQAYLPSAQQPMAWASLVIRTQGDPNLLRPAVESELLAIDPNQPLGNVETLVDYYAADYYAPNRVAATLLGAFALLATVLAALGIYGVMAYAASQRRHEIGIRMALGANRGSVLRLLVSQGMRLALIGLAIGLLATLVLGPLIDSQLFEVSPREPSILGVFPVLLALVALFACAIPARQASRANPVASLRSD